MVQSVAWKFMLLVRLDGDVPDSLMNLINLIISQQMISNGNDEPPVKKKI